MWKLSLPKTVCIVFLFCAATAIPLSAQTFTTLVSFKGTNGADSFIMSLVQGIDGNLYGTTPAGGANSAGTVFRMTPGGTLTTVYSFCSQGGTQCTDGAVPESGLVQGTDGNFYGTTTSGGLNGNSGTVFKITPGGTLTSLYSFNGTDASLIYAPVVLATDGNLYGTSYYGGANGQGVVFRITPSGTLTTLYSFCAQTGCADGANPNPTAGLVQATDGSFYGTTGNGGANNVACAFSIFNTPNGCGTVFKITPGGTLTTLYRFCAQTGCADGANPAAGLVQGTDGNFYGTTAGGANGVGTVFKITPGGILTTLYRFCAQNLCTDGAYPFAGLVQAIDGNFYSTTNAGGAMSNGTIFRLTPGGILTTLHSFNGTDGAATLAGLVQGTDGSFYGASRGGVHGTVFRLAAGLGPFVNTSPTSGAVGAAVIILGTNLTGATAVSFNGTAATFAVVSSSEIQTTVPVGATTGIVQVTTPTGTLNSNVPFQVTKPRKRRAQVTSV